MRLLPSTKSWKQAGLAALPALVPAILIWTFFDLPILHAETLTDGELSMQNIRWLGIPLVLIAFMLSGHYLMAAQQKLTNENRLKLAEEETQRRTHSNDVKVREEYVLEVISLGVTLDKHRQGKVWEALQNGGAYTTIREMDPKKYAWQAKDKIGISGGRLLDAFENAARTTPMYWGLPSFYAGAPSYEPPTDPVIGLGGSTQGTGLAWHLWINAPWKLAERPDRLLEQVFAFFDEHPDVPFVVVAADESHSYRQQSLPPSNPPLVTDGYYVPPMPDTAAVFVLARRERVDPVRPYVWRDPENKFLQGEFRQMYYQLMDTVPTDKTRDSYGVHFGRPPTVTEWIQAAAAFAQKPEFHQEGHNIFRRNAKPYEKTPPPTWKPTPWFPFPWTTEQLEAFDNLPTLGYLHRPIFVPFRDADGNPLKPREQRQQVLMAGWQKALQTLPDHEREKGPARIIAGTNNNKEQLLTLTGMLHQYESEGGPAIDISKTAQFIDTDRRLGNTGAATFFMQMALGVM
ncbi:MAG: DUF2875 family protein, partial [Burkholderiaceae bacterium]|nr:DUF2875 family protein [Burkholderiaceae bacterium]